MKDPAYENFFISNASGIVNNRVHYDYPPECILIANQSAYEPEDQYALDFRNSSVVSWWINEVMGDFLKSDVLDGFYWDCPSLTNPFYDPLTPAEVDAANQAMRDTAAKVRPLIAAAGKWSLPMFRDVSTPNTCPSSCKLDWRPSLNCSSLCDNSPTTCVANLKKAMNVQASPGTMTIPYATGSSIQNAAVCETPSGVLRLAKSNDPLELNCLPGTGTLQVDFASFGTPTVNATGRFIQCQGDGCDLADPGARVYWHNMATKLIYDARGSDCTDGSRTPELLSAAEFAALDKALEPLSCSVVRDCKAFAADSTCDAGPAVLAQIQKQCNGKQNCVVDVAALNLPASPGSGCSPGADLQLAVRASGCQQGTAFANFQQHLAAFLLTRGPQTWMGHGWIAGNHPTWYPEWDIDFGVPLGNMVLEGNVATRAWSKMNVTLDCNTFTAGFAAVSE